MFPGLIVHRSGPNRTARDRRSLLLCYQPAGRPELAGLPYRPERLDDLPDTPRLPPPPYRASRARTRPERTPMPPAQPQSVPDLQQAVLEGAFGPLPSKLAVTSAFWLHHTTRLAGSRVTYHNQYVLLRSGDAFGACAFEAGELDPDFCADASGHTLDTPDPPRVGPRAHRRARRLPRAGTAPPGRRRRRDRRPAHRDAGGARAGQGRGRRRSPRHRARREGGPGRGGQPAGRGDTRARRPPAALRLQPAHHPLGRPVSGRHGGRARRGPTRSWRPV